MLKKLLFGTILLMTASAALAFHCPADMKQIDAALAEKPTLTAEQLAKVRELRRQGEEYHQAGKHQQSVDALGQAKEILGI